MTIKLTKHDEGGAQRLAIVEGDSGKDYEIRRGKDDVIYCTCPGWRFNKYCKHLDAFMSEHTGEKQRNVSDQDAIRRAIESAVMDLC
jgi:uncharacterized Zn finger protein